MNKMHFYYFLPFLYQNQRISLIHGFNYLCNLCNLLTTIVAHPGARTWCHAFPWWALCCSLSSRTASSKQTKYCRL